MTRSTPSPYLSGRISPLGARLGDLALGRSSASSLVALMLDRIADPAGEGPRAFMRVYAEQAAAHARASDLLRDAGVPQGPLAGLPFSAKDLFDIQGDITRAGSNVTKENPPAGADAPAIERLRRAGAIVLGRATMVEFAFGGVGTNPHFGTPKSIFDRETGRVPGGSSSGSAVSVADGMAAFSVGSDTGGSCRIPAALNAIVGFKPTQARVPRDGAFPLSPSQDCIGPLAPTVACCALVDAVLAGETPAPLAPPPVRGLRFIVPRTLFFDDIEPQVAADFTAALKMLADLGADIVEEPLAGLSELTDPLQRHAIAAVESWEIHRAYLKDRAALYDPAVIARINRGSEISSADYVALLDWRRRLSSELLAATGGRDAWLVPTVPIVAPPIADVSDPTRPEEYRRVNIALLRNTSVGNFLDTPAISLPMHEPGAAPTGLMLMGRPGDDRWLLSVAASVEAGLHGRF